MNQNADFIFETINGINSVSCGFVFETNKLNLKTPETRIK